MILYPTETLYALGVNALDPQELQKLRVLKERDESKVATWLVRSLEDIEHYAEVCKEASIIASHFLPGKLTLVLRALPVISKEVTAQDGTIGFRISSDEYTQQLIGEFMAEYDAPLTCTSANISGLATLGTVGEILQQFGSKAHMIKKVVDGGPRKGLASTIIRVLDGEVTLLREGDISEADIRAVLQ